MFVKSQNNVFAFGVAMESSSQILPEQGPFLRTLHTFRTYSVIWNFNSNDNGRW
jgi:hypothetical protein